MTRCMTCLGERIYWWDKTRSKPQTSAEISPMRCWPRYLLWLVIAVLGTGNMLVACGRSGDLYLPDQTQTPRDQDRPKLEDEGQSRVPETKY